MKNLIFVFCLFCLTGCNKTLFQDELLCSNADVETSTLGSEEYRLTIQFSSGVPNFFLVVDIQDGETGIWSTEYYDIPTNAWGVGIMCKKNDFLYIGFSPIEGYWWSGGYGYGEHDCLMNSVYGGPYLTILANGDPNHRVMLDFSKGELGEVKLSYSSVKKNYIGSTYYFKTNYNLPANITPKIIYSSKLGSGTIPLTYVEDGLYRFDFIPSNSNYSSYMDIQVLPDLYNPENIDLKGLFMHEESFTVAIPF